MDDKKTTSKHRLASMTGFTRVSDRFDAVSWSFEIRSVNGKNLELRGRFPNSFDQLEAELKPTAVKYLSRGKISISSQFDFGEKTQKLQINEELLDSILTLAESHKDRIAKPTFESLLAVKGVIESIDTESNSEEQHDETLKKIIATLDLGFKNLAQARYEEGAKLLPALLAELDQIEQLVKDASQIAEDQPEMLKQKVTQQIQDILIDAKISEDRLAQEVAILVTKADIREELDRLNAHIQTGRALLQQGSPVGRKLDFLCQEFNREANTLCSKSSNIDLTNIGLSLKSVIEQFREQVQNIE